MLIKDVMTPDCRYCNSDTTLADVARMMADDDIGAVPVGRDEKLIGMVTDRDLVVRGLARGADPAQTPVSEIMAAPVLYCHEDQDCADVARNMAENQVRRLPVVTRDKRLSGVVSLGDLARGQEVRAATHALEGIAQA